jgi:putative tryptophan/tyrosine transport system substrate-binding protein
LNEPAATHRFAGRRGGSTAACGARAASGGAGCWIFWYRNPGNLAAPPSNFRKGLAETGFVQDQNVTFEYRWAEYHYDKLPALAQELVQRQVAVIVATGGEAGALAARSATTTIPIVFNSNSDPVQLGLVASLNRPGGNLTGVSNLTAAPVMGKRIELLHTLLPNVGLFGLLLNKTARMPMPMRTRHSRRRN